MSYLNNMNLPRGLRNNNPGNLIKTSINWKRKIPHSINPDERFEQFYEIEYGYRAMLKDLFSDYSRKGLRTVTKIIHQFAPPHENNTQAYVNAVANKMGVDSKTDFPMTRDNLVNLGHAIALHENGNQYSDLILKSDIEQGFDISGIDLNNVKKKVCPSCHRAF